MWCVSKIGTDGPSRIELPCAWPLTGPRGIAYYPAHIFRPRTGEGREGGRVATEFPKKHFYKIGEVCSLTDTQPYVLRFWESEFPQLAPNKSRTGQRIYRPRDVEFILEIKKLLYEEGYTIAGARKKLGMDSETSRPVPDASEGEPTPEALALLDTQEEVRASLSEILALMDSTDRRLARPDRS